MYRLEKFYPNGFNPQHYWDGKYSQEHIAGTSSDEFRTQGFWPLLQKYFERGKHYLDAGCGIGGWILFLKEEGYDVEGIDVAARTIRALTEYDPELRVKIASITEIPHPAASFDGVLAIGTLEYLEDTVPVALREVRRVLKSGGVFFAEVPVANVLRRLFYIPLKRLERAIKVAQGRPPTFANYFFELQELRRLLEQAGFEVLTVVPHELPGADTHYGLYVDWLIFRGAQPYKLNIVGRIVKTVCNAISPWIASTGAIVVARKK